MLLRRETAADGRAVAAVTAAAFARPKPLGDTPVEVTLVDELRVSGAWLPALSLVAETGGGGPTSVDRAIVGHVVCTRGRVGRRPALGLGPLGVHPEHQRRGVGSALMHAVLGAAEALDEPLVVLLGDGRYYGRFGFVPAATLGITPPVAGGLPTSTPGR